METPQYSALGSAELFAAVCFVQDVINRHAPSFAHGGATLSMQRVHGNFFVALDVNPMAVAVGAPGARSQSLQ